MDGQVHITAWRCLLDHSDVCAFVWPQFGYGPNRYYTQLMRSVAEGHFAVLSIKTSLYVEVPCAVRELRDYVLLPVLTALLRPIFLSTGDNETLNLHICEGRGDLQSCNVLCSTSHVFLAQKSKTGVQLLFHHFFQ